MRVGGRFEVCMRSPEGVEHWTQGDVHRGRGAGAPDDRPSRDRPVRRRAAVQRRHRRSNSAPLRGTLMEVVQTYTVADAAQVEPMLKGAPEGWRQTLDKLEAEVARMQASGGGRSVVHGAFHLERTYDATAEQVYKALSDEAAKNRWFHGPEGWRPIERFMDFRVGGRERAKGQLRRRRDDDVRRDLSRHRSARADRLHLRDASRRAEDFRFPRDACRSSPRARDARSSRFASRARSSTATTTRASANTGRASSSTSSARRSASDTAGAHTSPHESFVADRNSAEIAKRSYRAYVDKDRSAIERLIAEDFHFTSPLDNRLDRKTYFERCWPNCRSIEGFDFIAVVPSDDRVYVTYVGHSDRGRSFRNTGGADRSRREDCRGRGLFRLEPSTWAMLMLGFADLGFAGYRGRRRVALAG